MCRIHLVPMQTYFCQTRKCETKDGSMSVPWPAQSFHSSSPHQTWWVVFTAYCKPCSAVDSHQSSVHFPRGLEPVSLCSSGEVTPGITQTEYELRRQKLASLIEAQADKLGPSTSSGTHVVIVLSHPTRYMTNDIPYPFHQNQVT